MSISDKVFGKFSKDIGIDLGTANTLVYVRGKGIMINEPSVVALNTKTKQILAIGNEAKRMVGRTPGHIVATRPLVDGVISDFEVTEQMLRYFIDKVHQQMFNFLARPRVVIGIPSGVTEVEKRAVQDATLNAGARMAFLIEEPMAAAIGSRLPVQDPSGSMIVDIGGGTAEIAVISLGGIVVSKSIRIAGDEMNENIIQFARDEFNLMLGERTAEDVKIKIGSAFPLKDRLETKMRGRDLVTGLPKEVGVNDEQIRIALSRSIRTIVNSIRQTIEETPPELVADIMQRGIILAGGGALLRGIDELIHRETQIPVHITDDPLTAVVRGAGIVLEDLESLKEVLVLTEFEQVPR
ncbi:MAG: rod shape-determining protein [Candidatus Doudnabacteria bacterium RIFCSPHIGHO2_02_FULL_48_21]|uniref:Cell shape-determining protein MreB n=1 Tax=Candidatus Doudnabacteria bacterium RIFCSPLOWO2_02_FULL_48_13 TaxID=1817845 RepID=A0A1F5QCU6_9BACT|nr:MAG: rod shape-determining protein [Candidatus Doudnabacteria bacterium RIFCSPHIGHO2_01_48_18]OGE79170.1 MAG: rod shape-determining protein [Candidatus Doudnabacteria bacterium RIFCSPHIGHO2_01_FULL_48_180]OGE91802.1 MAG: rod shape-determining protein [Candidatus Doudnabacteria bacterium RIFCSPHIGHO2_12_FULL_47_25]OGE93652.1 MAG: rod shape-determining protein [Candidatus Doudnabacteria bacterium RIFCSPHIGHO2_02_FULL_48_21]OGE97933.1 MAG: rod shape-determining protein [Candidatus Doudnabacteri